MSETTESTLTTRERTVFGVLGAVYLSYILAWLFAVRSNQLIGIDDRFHKAMMDFGDFFAIVSPALWFFAVMSQVRATRWRVLVLTAGLAILFPFPLFFGVTAV